MALPTDAKLESQDNRCNHDCILLIQHLLWLMCQQSFREARSNLHHVAVCSVCMIIRLGKFFFFLIWKIILGEIVVGHYPTSMEKHVRWDPSDTRFLTAGYPFRDLFI